MFRRTCPLLQQVRLDFVPSHSTPLSSDLDRLQTFINTHKKLLILTGAGLSTESGIPDYRSERVGLYARTDRRPMNYQDFVKSAGNRQRYWARNYVGWPQFASFEPNESHQALAQWEDTGKVQLLVTQNVDALHTKAGSRNVVELHGCSHRVTCLTCHTLTQRWDLQEQFQRLNPDFKEESVEINPDGDVLLSEEQVQGFQVPACASCGGVLKPDVVFFGDNVPRAKVDHVFSHVAEADAMLIVGSSLHVYSAYRFVKRARELAKPIALINIGATRADDVMQVKVAARCGHVIPHIRFRGEDS